MFFVFYNRRFFDYDILTPEAVLKRKIKTKEKKERKGLLEEKYLFETLERAHPRPRPGPSEAATGVSCRDGLDLDGGGPEEE